MILVHLLACAAGFAAAPPPAPPPVEFDQPPIPPVPTGSLWGEVEARALIGMDGNARRVGDLITVIIEDSSSTTLGADTNTSRASSTSAGIDALLGLDTSILNANPNMGAKIGLGGTHDSSHAGSGETSREGNLEATVTCKVVQVLPNGNLRIRGNKTLQVNREVQYLTLEGEVRPRDILIDNTVRSDLIADVRVRFDGQGVVADKQGPGWGTRAVDAVWPF